MVRKVKVNRPDVCGILRMLTPPISNEFQVFSGGLSAVGIGISAGATVDEGWLTALAMATLGDPPFADAASSECPSFVAPFVSTALIALGF